MRSVYFTHNKKKKKKKKKKKIDAIITYVCFGIVLVEISPAGAFLR